jgi:hypothetical protein
MGVSRKARRTGSFLIAFVALTCHIGCKGDTTVNSSVVNAGASGQAGAPPGGAGGAGSGAAATAGAAGEGGSGGGSVAGAGGASGKGSGGEAGGAGGEGARGGGAGGVAGSAGGAAPDVDCRTPGASPRQLSAYQVEITAADDFSRKSMLASARGGGGYLLAWNSTETTTAQVVVQVVDMEGKAVGPRHALTGSAPHDDAVRPVRVVWDEDRGKFVVGWIELEKGIRLQVVSPAGEPEGSVIEVGQESNLPYSFSLTASEGDILVPHDDISNGATFPYVTATGTVEKVPFACYCAWAAWFDFQPRPGGFVSLSYWSNEPSSPARIYAFQPTSMENPSGWVSATYPAGMPYSITTDSRLVPGDGSKYQVASPTTGGVTMDTFATSGAWLEALTLLTKPVDKILSVTRAPPSAGGADVAAVLGKQGMQYLVGGSSLDGASVMATKAVVGGAGVSGGALHWGGESYLVFWMDKPSTYERIYSARLHCQ